MRVKGKWSKGEMARTIVIYLLRLLTMVLIWACTLKTIAVLIAVGSNPELGTSVDLSDVLGYAGGAAVSELGLLAFKRVFAKKNGRMKGVHMENIKKRLGNLLSVKSLVTLTLTGVFAYMSVAGKISQDFMTIYAVIIAFYFGTQSQKTQDVLDSAGTPQEGEQK